jgi:hypothetical protein
MANTVAVRSRVTRTVSAILACVSLLVAPAGGPTAALASITAAEPIEVIHVPLRWCVLEGSPAERSGEWDRALLRRQRLASDRIWVRKAHVTFRSAVTSWVSEESRFPRIRDLGGPGEPGDVRDPKVPEGDADRTELDGIRDRCDAAWDDLGRRLGHPFHGPVAINIRRFVTKSGEITHSWGYGGRTGPKPADYCEYDGEFKHAWGGYIMVVDSDYTGNSDGMAVAHELGHVLMLGHGDGVDDKAGRGFDDWCDDREDSTVPESLMDHFLDNATDRLSPPQRSLSRRIARKYAGAQVDPDGLFVDSDDLADERTDGFDEKGFPVDGPDVSDPSIDLTTIRVAVNERADSVALSESVTGPIPDGAANEYLLFVDVDGDPNTGGTPSDVGIQSGAPGLELITSVVVTGPNVTGATAWVFRDLGWVDVTGQGVTPEVSFAVDETSPTPLVDGISVDVPRSMLGPIGMEVEPAQPYAPLQARAIALQGTHEAPGGEVDVLPGGGGDPLFFQNEMVPMYLERPAYPTCSFPPDPVLPGDPVSVVVERFGTGRDGAPIEVFLGADQLEIVDGVPTLDDNGATRFQVTMPAGSPEGLRVINVQLVGTALEATCVLPVGTIEELDQE